MGVIERVRKILAPPTFEDEDLNRSATILNTILLSTFFILVVGVSVTASMMRISHPVVIRVSIIIGISALFVRTLLLHGKVKLAALFFCGLFYLLVTISLVYAGALRLSASYYFLSIFVAALLVGPREGLIFLVLTSVTVFAIGWADEQGLLQTMPIDSSFSQVIVYIVSASLLFGLIYAVRQSMVQAIEHIRRHEDEIRRLNAELEARVQERTAQLEAVNKELEAFAYSVSHDLRAPLRGINGYSRLLLDEYGERLDELGKEYLHWMRAASQQMDRLIDDLLVLSRVARREMHLEEVDLSELARQVVENLRQERPDRQVEVIIPAHLPVGGDAHLLNILLRNLLDNAFKFTYQQEHPRVELGWMQMDGEQVYFVRDNGVGFDMAFAHKLFEPFQRLHPDLALEGTGIGLATVKRIVHRHQGRVWAEAAVGAGATFFFTLGRDLSP